MTEARDTLHLKDSPTDQVPTPPPVSDLPAEDQQNSEDFALVADFASRDMLLVIEGYNDIDEDGDPLDDHENGPTPPHVIAALGFDPREEGE